MLPPKRESFEEIILFGEKQLPKLGVDVRLGVEADVETILAENPQAVVVATGSTPYLPEIPGAEGQNVLSVEDVLNGAETGDRVVIVDTQGTAPASLLADFLAEQGEAGGDRDRFKLCGQRLTCTRRVGPPVRPPAGEGC